MSGPGKERDVGGGKLSGSVIEPDLDGFAGPGVAQDEVLVEIGVDVAGAEDESVAGEGSEDRRNCGGADQTGGWLGAGPGEAKANEVQGVVAVEVGCGPERARTVQAGGAGRGSVQQSGAEGGEEDQDTVGAGMH